MPSRRQVLIQAIHAGSLLAVGNQVMGISLLSKQGPDGFAFENLGPLLPPNQDGLRLPKGFSSRIIARSGKIVEGTDYVWHKSPDGGACFQAENGGWIYVSNAEEYFPDAGVSAIHFNQDGSIKSAYRILAESEGNCAGGATPWGTWLSCEEIDCGAVYETDPAGKKAAVKLPALGYFKHEAVAVDHVNGQLYLTEDERDGCLYRFTPKNKLPDLSEGLLEVAIVKTVNKTKYVTWQAVENPTPDVDDEDDLRTRYQVSNAKAFKGGEGIWYHQENIFFSTKRDNRIWQLNIQSSTLSKLYDAKKVEDPILTGVDNLTMNSQGQLLVAEDDGDLQLVLLDKNGVAKPLLQVVHEHQDWDDSELTGPAFSPDGKRLYFSSQRGIDNDKRLGVTYEVSFIG